MTRKIDGKTGVRYITETIPLDTLKFTSMFNEKLNETLFSNVAILVEGPVDKILLTRAFDLGNVQPDIKNISVAECGGVSEVKFMAKILKEFGVNVIVLCDQDKGNIITERELNEISKVVGNGNILLYDSSLEEEYGVKKLSKTEAIRKSFEYKSLVEFPKIIQKVIENLNQLTF